MRNLILLSGPSIANFPKSLKNANVRTFSINRKSKIEIEILGRGVDFWYIGSPPEFLAMFDEIKNFLARAENNALLTTTYCLKEVLERIGELPNSKKIIIVDKEIEEVHGTHGGKNHWNSLSVLLFWISKNLNETTYIFGMDGVAKPGEATYFGKDALDEKRLVFSRLYEDMKFFDENFEEMMREKGQKLKVFNANPDSFYHVFPKSTPSFHSLNSSTTNQKKLKKRTFSNLQLQKMTLKKHFPKKSGFRSLRRRIKSKIKDFFTKK